MFYAYCISCYAWKLSLERTRKEKKELDEEEVNLTGIKVANAIDEGLFVACFNL